MTVVNKIDSAFGTAWFDINGTDSGTGWEFDGAETFGLTDDSRVLDCDGCPLTEGDLQEIAVKNALVNYA